MDEKLIFKGIQLVTKATVKAEGFVADPQILYFVRTREDKKDGYLMINGKMYATGVDDMEAVSALLGELPEEYKTFVEWLESLEDTIGVDGKPAVLYTDVDEYNSAKGLEGEDALSEDAFNALSPAQKVKVEAEEATGLYKTMDEKIEDAIEEVNGAKVTDVIYVPASEDVNPTIKLKFADNTVSTGFDASAFLIDGILSNVELAYAKPSATEGEEPVTGTFLKFTWNTDANKEVLYVDVADFINLYTADETTIHLDDKGVFSAKMDVDGGVASHEALEALDAEVVKKIVINEKEAEISENTATVTIDGKDIKISTDIEIQTGKTEDDKKTVIAKDETIEDALEDILNEITDNEEVTAAALNDLKTQLDELDATKLVVGAEIEGADEDTTEVPVSDVLAEIYEKLANANSDAKLTSTGKTINVTENEEGEGKNIEVNLEEATATTVAAGHIEIKKNTDGALYGVMYFGGDDVDE